MSPFVELFITLYLVLIGVIGIEFTHLANLFMQMQNKFIYGLSIFWGHFHESNPHLFEIRT